MGYHSLAKVQKPSKRDKMSPQHASKSSYSTNKRQQLFQQPKRHLPIHQKSYNSTLRTLSLPKASSSIQRKSSIPLDPNPFKRKLDEGMCTRCSAPRFPKLTRAGNGVDELLENAPKKRRGSDSGELVAIYKRRTNVRKYAVTVRKKRDLVCSSISY